MLICIKRGMYGLPEAGIIANKLLKKRLLKSGYYKTQFTPGLYRHVWQPIVFSLVVDDFEDYNDYPPDEVWSTWKDGYETTTNGSTIGHPDPEWNFGEHYVETSIVHGGTQSMPYFYDNTTAPKSEVTKTLTSIFRGRESLKSWLPSTMEQFLMA